MRKAPLAPCGVPVSAALGCKRCYLVLDLDLAGHCAHCAKAVKLAAATPVPSAAELRRVMGSA